MTIVLTALLAVLKFVGWLLLFLLALLELIRAGRIKVEDEGQLNLDRTHRRNKEASAHE